MSKWQVTKVRAKIRKGGKQREFIWEVTCPTPPAEPSWGNDFRPERCGCRRFPTEGKARRYVERMTTAREVTVDILPEGIIVTPSGKLVGEW